MRRSDNSTAIGGTAVLTDCAFSGDSANDGGGLYNDQKCMATLTDCTFTGDTAKAQWSGGNSASGTGGGLSTTAR